MKITKEHLRQIIREELDAIVNEGSEDFENHPLYRKIVQLSPDAEEALDEYIDSTEDDWMSDYVDQIESKGLESVAKEWINDLEEGNLGDSLAAFAAQDKEDAFYLREAEGQEGSFLQISVSNDGYDRDIEQISNPNEVNVDVSENPYVAYRAVVKVIKSSGEL